MKNRKVLFGTIILIACLAVVSVALSGSLPGTAPSRTSPTTVPAIGAQKASPTAQNRREQRLANFIAGILDLRRLTSEADLIVIGRVKSISDQGRAIASLSVDKVVKGDAASSVDVEFQPELPAAYADIESSSAGMFFLSRNANSGFRFVDPKYPYLIARADASLAEQPPLDRVVDIIGQVLLKPGPIEDRRLAVRVLSSAPTEAATELLRQAARDKDVVIRMHSISALLNRDDVETLAIAEPLLLNPPAKTDQYLIDNVSSALAGIKNPRAIPALQRLLRAADSRTRLGAVSALRQMNAQDAIEALVIALGDSNRDVRYEAVIGLAEVTGQKNEWAPAMDTFAQNEQRYLDHWKEWSRTR
jgi:hypothetical protein